MPRMQINFTKHTHKQTSKRIHIRTYVPMNLNRLWKHVLKFSKVNLILDKDPIRLQQKRKRLNNIQPLCNFKRHDSLGEVHHHHIETSKIILGKHHETLGSVPEPPFHLVVVEMRLCSKVLEGASWHSL